ncbi:hypothetical protein PPERSA_06885 [Pseudocohnilembus persalinus]|uniref:Transmembrane protein n=1 Tax=Pseudocohnilembus persalinus TaxID=266149 RepID=A0A0V0QYE0_PSEPJ|nr:hypothetical protein PPERSA_06885 [Pseudocohnilembus persalinus]|eukprot:KRX07270.1 hypothetical protein PPERSA_06885 [Pseudocohnilembus persalinus]
MELEKTLFRVYQKILTEEGVSNKIKICSIINFIIGGIFFVALIVSDLKFRNSPGLIGTQFNNFMDECFEENKHLRGDFLYTFILCDYDPQELAQGHKEFQESQNLDTCDQKVIYHDDSANQDGESNNKKNSDGENTILSEEELIKDVQKGGKQENLENKNKNQSKNSTRRLGNRPSIDENFLDEYEQLKDGERNQKQKMKQLQEQSQFDGENIIKIDGFQNNQVNITNSKSKISKEFRLFDESKYCKSEPTLYLQMSQYDSLVKFPKEYKSSYSFLELKFIRSEADFAEGLLQRFFYKYMIQYENIYIMDMINTFSYQEMHIKNVNTTEHWRFPKRQQESSSGIFNRILVMFFNFIKINIGLFLTCAITSIYIKTIIVCAPVFILAIIACLNRLGNQDLTRNTLYRAFPWIGIYLHTLDREASKTSYLVKSFLSFVFLFYCIYLSSSIYISEFSFFYKSIPLGLDENFFGFQAFLEFGVLIFIRTRSGIKWYPSVTVMLILCFLIYIQQTIYGFYYLAYNALLFTCFGYLGLILYYFEVPAMTWNPSFNFTPTAERPRTLYFPLYTMNWFYDLPQLWTMFYPLHGRKFFTQDQLSLVDRDYIRLNNYLRNGVAQQQQQQFNALVNINQQQNNEQPQQQFNGQENAGNLADQPQNNENQQNINIQQRDLNHIDNNNIENRNQNINNNNNSGSLLRGSLNQQIELGPINQQSQRNDSNNSEQGSNYIRMRNQGDINN